MDNLIYKEEAYKIIGAAMNVHKELGIGFLEPVYQEALAIELTSANIPFTKEQQIAIYYKEQKLNKYYQADFICYENIILEVKALNTLTTNHEAQMINYLVATKKPLGILINFGTKSLQTKRIINNINTPNS